MTFERLSKPLMVALVAFAVGAKLASLAHLAIAPSLGASSLMAMVIVLLVVALRKLLERLHLIAKAPDEKAPAADFDPPLPEPTAIIEPGAGARPPELPGQPSQAVPPPPPPRRRPGSVPSFRPAALPPETPEPPPRLSDFTLPGGVVPPQDGEGAPVATWSIAKHR